MIKTFYTRLSLIYLVDCVLAAVLHGYELHEEQGLFKCRIARPVATYDVAFEEENGLT
jgi:hypothetical protein